MRRRGDNLAPRAIAPIWGIAVLIIITALAGATVCGLCLIYQALWYVAIKPFCRAVM